MNALLAKEHVFKRMFANILSAVVIAAMLFPVDASANALELCNDTLGCVTLNPEDPLHIAYALAITGSVSSLGIDSRNGIEIAIDDSGGQILGHDIQFDGVDEACSEEGGFAAGSALADDPTIVAVIGTSCSVSARTALPSLSTAGFAVVSPSNTAPDLTAPGDPNHYPGYLRTAWNDREQGKAAGRFAREYLGFSTAVTVHDGGIYSGSVQNAFVEEFTNLGGTVVDTLEIDPNQTDFTTELAAIALQAPEMIYVPIFMPAAGYFVNQARMTAGLENTQLVSADSLWTEEIVSATGENVEGLMLTGWDSSKYSPAYQEHFLPAYQAKFGTEPISSFHAQAYDAFMIVRAAIEKVALVEQDGTIQIGRQALRDVLYGTTDFSGLTGNLTCNMDGDCADPRFAVYQYHTGQFPPEIFWPQEPPPAPYIAVSLTINWISLTSFLPDTPATVSVYEAQGSGTPVAELTRNTDASGNLYINGWEHNWDLEPGNFVVATDGATTKELLLEHLTLDVFDPSNDVVSGHALPGRTVGVGAGNASGEQWMTVYANGSGIWTADYTKIGFDLTEDMWAGGHVNDEDGDVTAAHNFGPPLTNLNAFPEGESVQGWNWPVGEIVNLTIDDPATEAKPDFEQTQTVIVSPWDPNSSWVTFNFAGEYDLKLGDIVTLKSNSVTRIHTVRNLSIEKIDPEADTIEGTADAGAEVYVWPHGYGEQQSTADENGMWLVDFSGIFDLSPDRAGRSEVRDDEGNSTAVDWYILNPHFTVFPEWNALELVEWPIGAPIHLSIDDPETADIPDFEADYTIQPADWDPSQSYLWIDINGSYDIKAGDIVTIEDDKTTRIHTVRNLAVTKVDQDADTVSGTVDGDATLYVWPHATGEQLQATADSAGNWQVDFQGVFDIVAGEFGRSEIRDEFGNSTAVDWGIPMPWLIAFPEYDAVEGWEWPEGANITLTIDRAPGLAWQGTSAVTTWGDPRTYVRFEFANDFDLKAGDVVTLTDGATVREHVVQNLSVTEVNESTESVTGTADALAEVQVWPHGFGPDYTIQAVAGEDGTWIADFASLGFDLTKGTGGRSQVVVDGNSTAVDWQVPIPYDIYIFDTRTKQIRQLTNSPDTHEYNPRWSPDGKRIVHDTWSIDWSSHGIYITDVATGQSKSLTGAEGGSYPTWSPSGRWIAFDHGADGDNRLFILPPTGGVPKLVTEDAFMPAWSPNSQRLAYHQPSDGSIRTVDVNGGSKTLVAASGNGPAWSPDGEWIAFERDGDVWKVRVNNNGMPLGAPIQLTSSPLWEGRPTWSNNSKTIAYHAGMGQDTDIWTIPAAGGVAAWLTGAPIYGDYDPNYSFNGNYIAYSSFSPDGQAARLWAAEYTYDLPARSWSSGQHTYRYEWYWGEPEPGMAIGGDREFIVSSDSPTHDGYVLLSAVGRRRGIYTENGLACEGVEAINPDQPTRFIVGWLTDYDMTYEEALAHFDSMTVKAVWDDGQVVDLERHEILSWSSVDWAQYSCSFTEP